MGDLHHRGDVGDLQQRVGRALQQHDPGVGPHGRFPGLQVGGVDQGCLHPEARQPVLDDPVARANQRPAGHQMVTGLEQAGEGGVHRRHARGQGAAVLRALQQRQPLLEHLGRRAAVTGIDEPGVLAGEPAVGRRRALVGEALGQIDRLTDLAVVAAHLAAADQTGCGFPAVGVFGHGYGFPARVGGINRKPGRPVKRGHVPAAPVHVPGWLALALSVVA